MSITHELYLLAAVVSALLLLTSFISLDSGWDRAHQLHRPAEFFHAPRVKFLRSVRSAVSSTIGLTQVVNKDSIRFNSDGEGRSTKKGCKVKLQSAQCRINSLVKYWDEVTDCYVSPLRRVHGLQVHDHRAQRFVVFQPDEGGWNNIRMALEVVVLVAQVRTATTVT